MILDCFGFETEGTFISNFSFNDMYLKEQKEIEFHFGSRESVKYVSSDKIKMIRNKKNFSVSFLDQGYFIILTFKSNSKKEIRKFTAQKIEE